MAAIFLATSASGCGLIFGGDQSVDNKSHNYTVVRLDRGNSPWNLMSSESDQPKDAGDVAFEHSKTGAIISLNSVCREYREASLEELSRYLLLGLNTQGEINRREIKVAGVEALESTVSATMSQRRPSGGKSEDFLVTVRAVVLRKGGCTYDLMYIARPDSFENMLGDFDRFLKGFHAD